MGGFLGIGGSSAKTDRKTQLTGFGELNNLFNFGLSTGKDILGSGGGTLTSGKSTTASGTDALTQALSYFKKLSSGDRTVLGQAVAPEVNAALASSDAARAQRATTGTGRSGGAAAAELASQDKTMADIDNFLFGARPAAEGQVANIGKEIAGVGLAEQGVGLSEESLGLGFAGLGEQAAAEMTSLAGDSRKTSYAINQDTVKNVTGAIENILAAFV